MDDVAAAFVDEATRIIEAEAFDEGTLARSVETEKPSYKTRIITWTSEHSVYVHYGTRAHWPPLAPILAWVKRNFATVIGAKGNRYTTFKPGAKAKVVKTPDKQALEVAHAIQAKIARDGTAPVPWVPRALSRTRPKFSKLLADAVNEEMK